MNSARGGRELEMNEDVSKETGSEEEPEMDSNGETASQETASISDEVETPVEEDGNDEAEAEEAEAQEDPSIEEPARQPADDDEQEKSEEPRAIVESPETSGRMRWYVLHTYSGREAKVRDTVERLIKASGMEDRFGKVLVATEEVAEMKKGKKKVSKRKLFPSYILIEMEMSNETWSLIENVPGVTHFVGGGKKPFPIPRKEVDRILGRMEKKEGIIPEVPFTIGEHVNVIDGPFSEFTGIVDEINPERGKLKVLVSIFGRETPVELDFLQVKPI